MPASDLVWPSRRQTDNDLMWIREPFLENGPQLPIFVIHGHTPGITVNIGNARLGIDTAAVATGKPYRS